MGRSLLMAGGANSNPVNNQFQGMAFANIGPTGTEANNQIKIRAGGTIQGLGVLSTVAATSYTATLRINGANAANTVNASGIQTVSDTTHSDPIAVGDLVCTTYTSVSGAAVATVVFAVFRATGNHTALYFGQTNSVVTTTASATRFCPYSRSGNPSATEANVQVKLRAAGTIKNASIFVSANATTGTSTYTNRVNGVNGALTIAIGAGLTGLFEDTTHSDTVASGDLLCGQFVTGATGGVSYNVFGVHFEAAAATGPANDVFGYASSATLAASGTGTAYLIAGRIAAFGETFQAFPVGYAVQISNLRIFLSANTYAANATFTLRKNLADAPNSTVSLTAGVTGWFEDNTHSDLYAATDIVAVQIVGGTSGSITIQTVATTWLDVTPPPFPRTNRLAPLRM